MILNILIAVLLVGFVALCIAIYQLDKKVQEMFYDINEGFEMVDEDICSLEKIVFYNAKKK